MEIGAAPRRPNTGRTVFQVDLAFRQSLSPKGSALIPSLPIRRTQGTQSLVERVRWLNSLTHLKSLSGF